MGQRSQIYVRYTTRDNKHFLTARYYQCNYGERMISRCRYTIEWINNHIGYEWVFTDLNDGEKLKRIMDINFDRKDIALGQDIIAEYRKLFASDVTNFNKHVFKQQHNNDGKLLIDVTETTIKYAFLDDDCNTNHIMTADEYLEWDYPYFWDKSNKDPDYVKAKRYTEDNIIAISEMTEIMSKAEIEDFLTCHYQEESNGAELADS